MPRLVHILLIVATATAAIAAEEIWSAGSTTPDQEWVHSEGDTWIVAGSGGPWRETRLSGAAFDLAGWSRLALRVGNPSPDAVEFHLLLRGEPGTWARRRSAGFVLRVPAGFTGEITLPIQHLRYSFSGWEWPMPDAERIVRSWGWIAEGRVEEVVVVLRGDDPLHLGGLALDQAIPATAWVDEYGQNTLRDWPGKIRDEADIHAGLVAEEALLHAPPIADRDRFQAWSEGPRLAEGDFFRVEQVDGRWWLVAPSGHLYFATGVCVVNHGLHANVSTPAAPSAHRWLPPQQGPFADAWRDDGFSFHAVNLRRIWGDAWKESHEERAIARLRAWGFTGIGNWSMESVTARAGLPWVNVGPNTWWPMTTPTHLPTITEQIHDVFHTDFPAEALRLARNGMERFRDDPLLIGHFIRNEVGWDHLVESVLAGPEDLPARQAFIARLLERHGDLAGLRRAWGQPQAEASTLRWAWKGDAPVPPAAAEDAVAFRGDFAERWFAGWTSAMRTVDPNHLILGCRFKRDERFPEVVAACGRHCDVVSFNDYVVEPDPDQLAAYSAMAGGRPLLIGEYAHNTLASGSLTAAVPVADQHERGIGYRRYTEVLATVPCVVGGHVFQYWDEPVTGRFDTETSANGFVAVTGLPWPDLVAAARATHERLYRVRSGVVPPFADRPRP